AGTSLDHSFPHVNSALRLAIARHKFQPGHLYKLDATIKEKLKPRSFEITDDDRDASPKDYPSFHSLFDPLVVYFKILQFFIISSGNIPAIQQVVLGCSEYSHLLYQIYSWYEWPAVLQYHFMFHHHHLAKMRDGDYSSWHVMDTELASLHLYGYMRASTAKSNTHITATVSSNAKQVCFAFQSGKCPSPCAHGHVHKCKSCQSLDHSRSTC
ncbi:hypothetical protein K439DRAFT_1305610, partial [Ramaria rubella]